jgi:hypothetical protein
VSSHYQLLPNYLKQMSILTNLVARAGFCWQRCLAADLRQGGVQVKLHIHFSAQTISSGWKGCRREYILYKTETVAMFDAYRLVSLRLYIDSMLNVLSLLFQLNLSRSCG